MRAPSCMFELFAPYFTRLLTNTHTLTPGAGRSRLLAACVWYASAHTHMCCQYCSVHSPTTRRCSFSFSFSHLSPFMPFAASPLGRVFSRCFPLAPVAPLSTCCSRLTPRRAVPGICRWCLPARALLSVSRNLPLYVFH